jgi:hypothetical protein
LDNVFSSDGEDGVYFWGSAASSGVLNYDVRIERNEFHGETGVHASDFCSSATVNALMFMASNVMDVASVGVQLSSNYASESAVFNRELVIQDNVITAGSGGIYISSYWDTNQSNQIEVVIQNNQIGAQEAGLYYWCNNSHSSSAATGDVTLDLQILDNEIVATSYCMTIGLEASETRGIVQYDVTIDGNDLQDGSTSASGLWFSFYHVGEAASSNVNVTINRNHFQDFGDNAASLNYDVASASMSYNQVMRGNVFENDATSASHIYVSWYGASGSTPSLDLDFGSHDAYGYNTIRANGVDPDQVLLRMSVTSSSADVTVDVVGNWWGTQDAGVIEDRVYHGIDDTSLVVADLSMPLADTLEFTAMIGLTSGGSAEIVITANGPGTAFVPFAGSLDGLLEISGPWGDVEVPLREFTSEDWMSIVIPVTKGLPPEGEYLFCVTNPGGQTGCASFTVEPPGDCTNNSIPTALSDSAETDPETAVTIDLVANDHDIDGNMEPTSVQIVQEPSKGTLTNNGDGTVTYVPDAGNVDTTDTFTYTVSDSCGAASNAASCEVRIGGQNNTIPTAVYDSATTDAGAAVVIDLLANDWDADGDALDPASVVITNDGKKGTVTLNGDGTATYTPDASTMGTTDTFNYTVDDVHGGTSNVATVEVSVGGIARRG